MGMGTTESDAVRKRTLRSLVLYSTPNWLVRAFVIVSSGILLYGSISGGFKNWVINILAVASVIAILHVFMRGLVIIDYDKDIIETKLWKVWSFLRRYRRGLADATHIQIIDVDSCGDPAIVTKFLVFSDGQAIELPATKEIETILSDWYEHFFHRQLPIQINRSTQK